MTEVYVILKNADFTEGRGPMLLHRVCDTFDVAEAYVMAQSGIFGSEQGLSKYQSPIDEWNYNGYSIRKCNVFTENDYSPEQRQALKAELERLEDTISEIKRRLAE